MAYQLTDSLSVQYYHLGSFYCAVWFVRAAYLVSLLRMNLNFFWRQINLFWIPGMILCTLLQVFKFFLDSMNHISCSWCCRSRKTPEGGDHYCRVTNLLNNYLWKTWQHITLKTPGTYHGAFYSGWHIAEIL